MDRTSTCAWRCIQNKRVWPNRLRLIFRAFFRAYLEDPSTGTRREAKTWEELRKVKWCQVYRTTGQPCSCEMCSGERYSRIGFKRDTERVIREELEILVSQ